jgi:hypothetical protein
MKFLVTGGPVHAKLDAVKIVTNKFKGGLMSRLAMDLHLLDEGHHITYLTGKGMANFSDMEMFTTPTVIEHDGFESYRQILHDTAKDYDAIILGAAVANIIPVSWQQSPSSTELVPVDTKGKFPSHNFKEGDEFQMTWKIAPRIINEVRQYMKPGAHLFGFKLLSGVPENELVTAAYEVLLGSKSATVFANDATNLEEIIAVGPDRSTRHFGRDNLAGEIMQLSQDVHYRTVVSDGPIDRLVRIKRLIAEIIYPEHIVESPEGLRFGTVAVRTHDGFATTGRGKRELDEVTIVSSVDHAARVVNVQGSKATLNAPLLDRIFKMNKDADVIEHYHKMIIPGLPVQPWAPPGTVRDTERDVHTSFYVDGHGCYIIRNVNGQRM